MEEKIVIQASFKKNYAQYVLFAVASVMLLGWFIAHIYSYNNYGDLVPIYGTYIYIDHSSKYDSFGEYLAENITSSIFTHMTFVVFILSILLFIISVLTHFYFRCEMTVTDKRVYGKSAFGKRIDLPLSKITSLTSSVFWSLGVATSTGKIMFALLSNRDEVYEKLASLIVAENV